MFRLLKTVGTFVTPLVFTPWANSESNNPPLPEPPPSYSSPFVSSVRLSPYEDIEKEVPKLIDSLGSKVFLEREYASERLLKLVAEPPHELPHEQFAKLFSQIVKALSTEYTKDWKPVEHEPVDHEKERRLETIIQSIEPNRITELILNKQIDENAVLIILDLKGHHAQFKNAALKAEGAADRTIQGFQKDSLNYDEIRKFFVLKEDQPPVNNNEVSPDGAFPSDLPPGDNFHPVNPQWRQINPITINFLAAGGYIVQRYVVIYPQTTSNALKILANTTEEEGISLDVIRHNNVTPEILKIYIKQFSPGPVKQLAEERLEQIEEVKRKEEKEKQAKQAEILKKLNIKPGTGLIGLP